MKSFSFELDKNYRIGWDGHTIEAHYLALDTETYLIDIDDPSHIPQLVLMSVFNINRQDRAATGLILPAEQVEDWLLAHQGKVWIFHNSAFDLRVLHQHVSCNQLKQKIWRKVDDYQIRDTKLLKGLRDIALEGELRQQNLYLSLQQVIEDLGLMAETGLDKAGDEKYRLNYQSIAGDDLLEIYHREGPNWFVYPLKDARATYRAYRHMVEELKTKHDFDAKLVEKWGLLTEKIQVGASIALDQATRQGISIDSAHVEKLRRQLDHQIPSQLKQINSLISTGLESDFDIRKHDKKGRLQLRKSGVPKLNKSQFFSYVDRRLKANSEVTGYQTPLSPKTAKISTAADQWEKYRLHDPALDHYLELDEKLNLFDFLPAESRVHPRYNILIRSGRTSSFEPNIQNVPRTEGIRYQYQASAGHVLITCDYAQIELAALAQICLEKYGSSQLAQVINQGQDLHYWTASRMMGCEISHLQQLPEARELRQKAKAVNFGIPGGLGAERMTEIALEQQGVRMSEAEAKDWIDAFKHRIYPEVGRYLKSNSDQLLCRNLGLAHMPEMSDVWLLINALKQKPLSIAEGERLTEFLLACRQHCSRREMHQYLHRHSNPEEANLHLFSEQVRTLTGRIRNKATYCQVRNTQFQGLAADGAKLALFELFKQGVAVVAFIHDEIIIEVPEGCDYRQQRDNLMQVMTASMKRVIPDVTVRVECNGVMKHWHKDSELHYVDDDEKEGQIIPID